MDELIICYEFSFNVATIGKKGRQRKSYALLATGISYSNAVWDMYFTLKKRSNTLVSINGVTVTRIAFALDEQQNFVRVRLENYPVDLPEDLNKELHHLPKKQQQ
jgi:hypothetical protein